MVIYVTVKVRVVSYSNHIFSDGYDIGKCHGVIVYSVSDFIVESILLLCCLACHIRCDYDG